MITVIIFVFFFIFLLVRWAFDWSDVVLFTLLGGAIGMLVGILVAIALPQTTEINTYTDEIVSLQDNSSMSGSFFLGSGQIEDEMRYVYYYRSNGGFKMNTVPYDKATVYYSDSTYIKTIKREAVKDWTWYWAIDKDQVLGYKIYVPEGTIKNNYNLDAK